MKKTNYVANDVAQRWLNKCVVIINVTLQVLNIYIYIYICLLCLSFSLALFAQGLDGQPAC